MTPLTQFLTDAKSLIKNPENWTQWEFARDKNDNRIASWKHGATKFCALGALHYFGIMDNAKINEDLREIFNQALITLNKASLDLFNTDIARLNDEGTHEMVMRAYERAIEISSKSNDLHWKE